MQSVATLALYSDLSTAHLLIFKAFKGDLNYRKLLADFNWNFWNFLFESRFVNALGVFRPTNLCTLRTIKADSADLICEFGEFPLKKADEL